MPAANPDWVRKGVREMLDARKAHDEKTSVTIGHCRDCEFWDNSDPYNGFGSCLIIHPVDGDRRAEVRNDLAAGSGLDCSGSLLTKPDFGCVQFERRES